MSGVKIKQIDFQVELENIAPAGRIGLIALATDYNMEQEMRHFIPAGMQMFTNRVLNANPLTLQNLRAMAPDIQRAAAGILPAVELDVMIYGCTSGTIANGADEITRLIHEVRPEAEVTTPATAAIAAFKHLGVRRVSIVTPYIKELNVEVLQYFEQHGLEVLSLTGLNFDDDVAISGIAAEDLFRVASTVVAAGAEALFLSCTALRTASVIDRLEQKLGIPVVSSNLALAWHCTNLTGCHLPANATGRLMKTDGAR